MCFNSKSWQANVFHQILNVTMHLSFDLKCCFSFSKMWCMGATMMWWWDDQMMSWCHDVMIRWCHDQMMWRCDDVMMSWCDDVMMSWCDDEMIRWCHDVMMWLHGCTVQDDCHHRKSSAGGEREHQRPVYFNLNCVLVYRCRSSHFFSYSILSLKDINIFK